MRKILLSLITSLMCVSSVFAADGINVGSVEVMKGSSTTLSFELVNTEHGISGVEFIIEMTEGLSFELNNKGKIKVTKGSRLEDEDFTLSVADQGNNNYKVLGYYTDGSTVPETGGELFSLTLLASKEMIKGVKACKVTGILLSTPTEEGITPEDTPFTVNVKATTVKANDYSRVYGDANPTFDYVVEDGTVNGTPELSCNATATSPVGAYTITVSPGTITGDGVDYVNGTLTINKAPLTARVGNYTITRGEPLPSFSVTYEGFKNGENATALSIQPNVNCSATSLSEPGVYDIVISGGEAQNYDFSYVGGKLTINKRSYTITAISSDPTMGNVNKFPENNTVEEGVQATLTAIANEGYHFVKWSNEVTDNPYSFAVDGNKMLSAIFAPNQYKMTFKLENGQDDIIKTQNYNSELTAPTGLTKEGYTFMGWDTEVPATIPASDKTFTALWQVNQYKMTFKLENGQNDVVKTQDYNSELTAPTGLTKEGYTFMGWDTEVPATIPSCDKTFTAQWQINQYKMTFKLENGQDDIVKTQDYNSELTVPTGLTKEGYTFMGWDTEVPATIPASDKTFTAQWQVNQYKMTFKLENGQDDIVKTQNYNSELTAPTGLTKEGYTFMGWDTEVPATIPASDKTFTAQWQVNQYKMTFKLENGQDDIVKTQNYNSELTAPTGLTKEGYTFMGWSPEVPTIVPAGDRTFIAQWQGTLYTMTFKLENGEDDIVKMQGYNTTLEKPADPKRDGYTFIGWDTEVPAAVPASDKTFTAQWQINSYKVKFVVDDVTVKEETLEYGAAIVKPADPRKDNFIFTGWSPVVPEKMPAGEQTFTAQWETVKYTITFVLDNGEADIVMRLEFGADLDAPTPKKTGYTFTGWDSEVPSTVPASDKTYKALWQVNKYKLIYMVDGEDYKSYELEFGAEITPEAIPVKEGYTFSGWSNIPATMPAGDYVIQGTFAEDKVIVNNIAYEVNGDNAIASGGVVKNGDLTLPETITSNGVTYQVTAIGKEAFKGNISLTSVNIPNTITTINDGAFDGCTNVKIIYIGSAVRNIGSKAFANINGADSREISTTADARYNRMSLTVVSYARNVPVTAPDAFENTDIESAGLMVDYRSLNDYSSVNPWRNFGSIIPYNRPTDVGSVKAEQGVSDSYFNLDGSRLSKPQRGIVIVREADGSVRKVSVK